MPKILKAHTPKDNRYKRANHVSMVPCPHCKVHTLREIRSDGTVWAFCLKCKRSGESEKIPDHHVYTWKDVVATFTDANPPSDKK